MSILSRHRSYTEKVLASRKRRKIAGRVLLVLIVVSLVRSLVLQSFTVDSRSMLPALSPGDIVLSFPLPLGAVTLFGKLPRLTDPRRGELVIVAPDPIPSESAAFRAWDSVARFFTFQRFSPMAFRYGEGTDSPGVYRVIGLPGDTIRSKASLFEIRESGASGFSTEFALAEFGYTLPGAAAFPGSEPGRNFSFEKILGAGEYFVACDDRSSARGSMLWGPVGEERLLGRVVAVAWPPGHMKIP